MIHAVLHKSQKKIKKEMCSNSNDEKEVKVANGKFFGSC